MMCCVALLGHPLVCVDVVHVVCCFAVFDANTHCDLLCSVAAERISVSEGFRLEAESDRGQRQGCLSQRAGCGAFVVDCLFVTILFAVVLLSLLVAEPQTDVEKLEQPSAGQQRHVVELAQPELAKLVAQLEAMSAVVGNL